VGVWKKLKKIKHDKKWVGNNQHNTNGLKTSGKQVSKGPAGWDHQDRKLHIQKESQEAVKFHEEPLGGKGEFFSKRKYQIRKTREKQKRKSRKKRYSLKNRKGTNHRRGRL